LLLNISASPWWRGKEATRTAMLQRVARDEGVPLVQVNSIGGNDELIFDGHSVAVNRVTAKCLRSEKASPKTCSLWKWTATPKPVSITWPGAEEQLFRALSLGLRDYVHKCGFKSVVLGLSGGIDSALTAVIAVDALGAENVLGISLPARYSSQGSLTDAEQLARNSGHPLRSHSR
jgi:NAD+ synthase (glutamine-hydrolysing)